MEMTLLDKFANPEMIKTLSMGEKLTGSLMVTVLGMGITFAVLVLLWGLIILMTNMLVKKEKETVVATPQVAPKPVLEPACDEDDEEELVAVITAAIAASLNTSTHNIVVRNIVRVVDESPAWARAGRVEQLGNRL